MKPAGLVAWSKTAAVRPAICYYGLMAGDNALVALATYSGAAQRWPTPNHPRASDGWPDMISMALCSSRTGSRSPCFANITIVCARVSAVGSL